MEYNKFKDRWFLVSLSPPDILGHHNINPKKLLSIYAQYFTFSKSVYHWHLRFGNGGANTFSAWYTGFFRVFRGFYFWRILVWVSLYAQRLAVQGSCLGGRSGGRAVFFVLGQINGGFYCCHRSHVFLAGILRVSAARQCRLRSMTTKPAFRRS